MTCKGRARQRWAAARPQGRLSQRPAERAAGAPGAAAGSRDALQLPLLHAVDGGRPVRRARQGRAAPVVRRAAEHVCELMRHVSAALHAALHALAQALADRGAGKQSAKCVSAVIFVSDPGCQQVFPPLFAVPAVAAFGSTPMATAAVYCLADGSAALCPTVACGARYENCEMRTVVLADPSGVSAGLDPNWFPGGRNTSRAAFGA